MYCCKLKSNLSIARRVPRADLLILRDPSIESYLIQHTVSFYSAARTEVPVLTG